MEILILAAAVIVVLIVFYIKAYNRLRRLSVKVEEGSAGIDVALEKRYDLLIGGNRSGEEVPPA